MEKLTDAIGIVLFESEKFGGEKVLRGGICPTLTISDIEPIERQCVYEDNKPCNSSCRYSNTCIHSASKTEE